MLRGRNNIILNNIKEVKYIDFYEDSIDLFLDCLAINDDNIIIPKYLYVLKEDILEAYCLKDTHGYNGILMGLGYETDYICELNDKGKDMYPLYCMMIDRDKYADIDINIDDFMKQYINN